MTENARKQIRTARAVPIFCLTMTLVAAASVQAGAQPSDSVPERARLVGTWMVQVTLRDCATSAPLGPPIHSLVTFHGHGTLSEAAGSLAFAPGQRSPGHGAWWPHGDAYQQEMIALLLFDTEPNLPGTPTFDPSKPVSPGFFAGWVTVSHTVRFTAVDRIASSGTNAFYKTNGELYRSGCSTATGRRFE